MSFQSVLFHSLYSYFINYGKIQADRMCIPVPLYHCSGMVLGSITSTMFGCTQVFPDSRFDSGSVLAAINDEKCTSIIAVPTMFAEMLNHKDLSQTDFSSFRTGVIGASSCPIELMKRIIKDMNCEGILIAYGLTETSPLVTMCSKDTPFDLKISSVGKIVQHMEVKIIDDVGNVVALNTPGELCFRGHCIFQGYWDDEEKTHEMLDKHGWFHTGDLGEIDEHGYCKVVGRIKDLIIRGGENIYPAEIENFLHTHHKIEDVQVFGVPDKIMGEEVCAWIKIKGDHTVSTEEIKEFCKGQISHFKIPRYIKVVDEFVMTVTGKAQKFAMRKEMIEELAIVDN